MMDFWSAVMRGRAIHIEHAKRLPRKKKKILKSIFKYVETKDCYLVSPNFEKNLTETMFAPCGHSYNALNHGICSKVNCDWGKR
jgi:hypothetical protein